MNIPNKKALKELHKFVKESFLRPLSAAFIKDLANAPETEKDSNKKFIEDLRSMLGRGKKH